MGFPFTLIYISCLRDKSTISIRHLALKRIKGINLHKKKSKFEMFLFYLLKVALSYKF